MPRADVILASFVLGLPLVALAVFGGHRLGLLDHPRPPIKPHARAVPYTGGTAVTATVVLVGLVVGAPLAILGGLVLMWGIGFIDDVRGLPPVPKLIAEIVPLGVALSALDLGMPTALLWLAAGLILVNAFNVIDGLDGLAGGVALPSLLVLAAAPGWPGGLASGAVGAIAAFLVFNLRPARVFLADQGSLVIGELIWIVPLAFPALRAPGTGWLPWSLLWAFPIVNSAFVVIVRLRGRRSILRGDRSHLYDVLDRRFGLARTLVIAWLIAAAGAVGALLAR